MDLDPMDVRTLVQRIIDARQADEPFDGWEPRMSALRVARAIEDQCAERFRFVQKAGGVFANPSFDSFLFVRISEDEQVGRRARRERGIVETPVERERWLAARRRQPPGGEPGLLLQICHAEPFAAWGERTASGSLEPAAIARTPPGDWSELVVAIALQLELAGWQVVPAELLRKPLPADIPFRCVWSPPYHVLDVVFYLND